MRFKIIIDATDKKTFLKHFKLPIVCGGNKGNFKVHSWKELKLNKDK